HSQTRGSFLPFVKVSHLLISRLTRLPIPRHQSACSVFSNTPSHTKCLFRLTAIRKVHFSIPPKHHKQKPHQHTGHHNSLPYSRLFPFFGQESANTADTFPASWRDHTQQVVSWPIPVVGSMSHDSNHLFCNPCPRSLQQFFLKPVRASRRHLQPRRYSPENRTHPEFFHRQPAESQDRC